MAMACGLPNSGPLPTRLSGTDGSGPSGQGKVEIVQPDTTVRFPVVGSTRTTAPRKLSTTSHWPDASMAMACGLPNSGPLPTRLSGTDWRWAVRAGPIRENCTARHDGAVPRRRINPHHCTERAINHEPLAGRFDGNGLRASKFGAAANEVVWNRRRRAVRTALNRRNGTARYDGAVPRHRINPHHCTE